MTAGAPEDASFEVLYDRLQAVTSSLEAGDLTLDESLTLYEEGVTLARRCQELLAGAQQRIEQLRQAFEITAGPADPR